MGELIVFDMKIADDSASIEPGQLLIIKRGLFPISFCNYKCFIIGIIENSVIFPYIHVPLNRMNFCWLTVVYLSILHHKLVFCLQHGPSIVSFSVGLVLKNKSGSWYFIICYGRCGVCGQGILRYKCRIVDWKYVTV